MAGSDYLLEMKGVTGEAQDAQYKQAIEIESWSFSGHNAATSPFGMGSGAGKVSLGDIQLTKQMVDTATPTLFKALCTGMVVPQAILHCRKKAGGMDGADQVEYLKITMTNATVTSLSLGGHGTATGVSESLSLSYEQVKFEYTPQNANGTKGATVEASFDLKQYKTA